MLVEQAEVLPTSSEGPRSAYSSIEGAPHRRLRRPQGSAWQSDSPKPPEARMRSHSPTIGPLPFVPRGGGSGGILQVLHCLAGRDQPQPGPEVELIPSRDKVRQRGKGRIIVVTPHARHGDGHNRIAVPVALKLPQACQAALVRLAQRRSSVLDTALPWAVGPGVRGCRERSATPFLVFKEEEPIPVGQASSRQKACGHQAASTKTRSTAAMGARRLSPLIPEKRYAHLGPTMTWPRHRTDKPSSRSGQPSGG